MSRRSKAARAALRAAQSAIVPAGQSATQLVEADLTPRADSITDVGIYGGYGPSGWQGASWSPQRGMIYWPTLDPRREIDTYSRTEIARKVHMLCANCGLPRRILDGLANLIVGTGLRPQALTTDTEWNSLSESAYGARAKSPLTFSTNARYTLTRAQRMVVRTTYKDGDAAVVFSESASGGALRAFYSGLQIGNARLGTLDQSRWRDGIMLDTLDRPVAYRFPSLDDDTFTDIPAANVRFLCRDDSFGQLRGMSALAPVVNKIIDVSEVNNFIFQAIKATSEKAYYISQQPGDKAQPLGIAATMRNNKITFTTPQGPVVMQVANGLGGEIASLPPGADLKMLLDQRPSENSREFIWSMIQDIAWATGLSADLLWSIYKLGGANVRYVMADAQVFISIEQQNLVDSWLSQDWVYTIAKEMKAGRLRPCADPDWWKHGWVPPARITVDFGRDGNMYLRWYQAGLITCARLFAMQGQDAREEIGKDLDLIAWNKQQMALKGVTWEDVRNFRGVQAHIQPAQQLEEDASANIQPDPGAGDPADENDDGNEDDSTTTDLL